MRKVSGISGDSRVYNPVTGSFLTVKEIFEQGVRPTVATLMGPLETHLPSIVGGSQMVEIHTIRGRKIKVGPGTRVLTPSCWCYANSLVSGQQIATGTNYFLRNVEWDQIAALIRKPYEEVYDIIVPIACHYSVNWLWVHNEVIT